ncbi:MAG: transcriptional repressor LexA [Anaerolineales bacterium]|jgi:repressor LexA
MSGKQFKLKGRNAEVYQALRVYIQSCGYPPTVREILERTSLNSTSHAAYCLKQLEKHGYISRESGVSRGIRLIDPARSSKRRSPPSTPAADAVYSIPIWGPIAAGIAIHLPGSDSKLYDSETTIEFPVSMLPKHSRPETLFALRVEGDSMVDALVNDGDIVILEKPNEVQNGAMVAAWLVADEATTLKYLFREPGRVRLQPANPDYDPVYIRDPEDLLVQGRVVAVHRQMW